MKIHLHIDRLVLDGLDVQRNHAGIVRRAIESELSTAIRERGLAQGLQSGCRVPTLRGEDLSLAKGTRPTRLGKQIAHAIYSGIGERR
jgi:hypothetical protein